MGRRTRRMMKGAAVMVASIIALTAMPAPGTEHPAPESAPAESATQDWWLAAPPETFDKLERLKCEVAQYEYRYRQAQQAEEKARRKYSGKQSGKENYSGTRDPDDKTAWLKAQKKLDKAAAQLKGGEFDGKPYKSQWQRLAEDQRKAANAIAQYGADRSFVKLQKICQEPGE